MTGLSEGEASIGMYYKRFPWVTLDMHETEDGLSGYFISKIFAGPASWTIVSWFFDGGPDIDFVEVKERGSS